MTTRLSLRRWRRNENERTLNKLWGGEVGATELYLAHFLGAGGAASFLNARDENPLTPAADLYPKAARANRGVFYDPKTGKARSLAQVYDFFDKKFRIKNVPGDPANIAIAQSGNAPVDPASFTVVRGEAPLPGAVRPPSPEPVAQIATTYTAPKSGQLYSFNEYRSLYQNTQAVSPLPALPELPKLPALPEKPSRASIIARPGGGMRPFHSLMTNPVDLMLLSQSDLNPAPQNDKTEGADDKGRMNG